MTTSRPNTTVAARTEEHARRVGMKLNAPDTGPGIWASTDFGNVSQNDAIVRDGLRRE